MSKVGKKPVEIPSGVTVSVDGSDVKVQGPKGSLEYRATHNVKVSAVDNTIVVEPANSSRQARADYGTTRAHINNMVCGVTECWKKALELHGVGFTAQLSGNIITLSVGYSHEVKVVVPTEVTANVQKTKIDLESINKHSVGQLAAKIRKVCPPEPYLGKGIRYAGEQVRRKAGKAGA